MPDFLGDVIDGIGTVVDNTVGRIPYIGQYIAPAALALTGNPELAAAYVGARNSQKTGDPLSGLLSGVGSYAGNVAGSSLGASAFGNTALGNLTSGAQNAFEGLTGSGFGQTIGGGIGSMVGGNFGGDVASQINPQTPDLGSGAASPFSPSRSPSMGLPQSLSQFSSLDPNQQASNIASKGVYGQGNGPEENQYFLNLINRQLVDDGGHVGSIDNINPVENSYLSQLGLGGYSNPNDLLQGISRYGQA